ncbi:hypothetical protein [Marinisporobacter balticus]|uniref:Uncharacterized protein n=1 Tax=Marinisporobacter balticus TaxID=2018667 RepID=A0A4R2L0N0_9FIRM|nr:hypothetical protein [Marinisporobacter balticus]TCO79964.1 hypothetical protein EV214_101198 [Marinisporobacter balticus]
MRLTVKSRLVSNYVQEWLKINNKVEATPKDVIEYLVAKKIYTSYALRNFHRDLRNLENRNMLHLIKGVETKQVKSKRYWILKKSDKTFNEIRC